MLIESFVPGTMERWGLGPDVAAGAQPQPRGRPHLGLGADRALPRPSPGSARWWRACRASPPSTATPTGRRVLPPLALADMIAGYSGAAAALMALREAERDGGRGQVVDLALFDPIFATLGPAGGASTSSPAPFPPRSGQPLQAELPAQRVPLPRRQGGRVAVGLRAGGRRAAVPRDRPARADRRPALRHQRGAGAATTTCSTRSSPEFIAGLTQDEALAHFAAADVTVGPVLDVGDLVEHPYIVERGVLAAFPDRADRLHAHAPRLAPAGANARRDPFPGARPGRAHGAVLAGIGRDAAAVAALRERGVV